MGKANGKTKPLAEQAKVGYKLRIRFLFCNFSSLCSSFLLSVRWLVFGNR